MDQKRILIFNLPRKRGLIKYVSIWFNSKINLTQKEPEQPYDVSDGL